jgi:hypothetical protein
MYILRNMKESKGVLLHDRMEAPSVQIGKTGKMTADRRKMLAQQNKGGGDAGCETTYK